MAQMQEPMLIPEPTRHEVRVENAEGPWGGPTLRYRGARIECGRGSHISGLFLAGHPLDGANFGVPEIPMSHVDLGIDEKRIPGHYVAKPQK
ncbi:hypothetical protein ACLF3G_25485 [Falsiroseomonas sp. HC035]|uniref:hypothetical protein n=1 Tax=Falsiroseomonas sp. HC035 TaxID=3390999 RepID=UPI003D31DCEC